MHSKLCACDVHWTSTVGVVPLFSKGLLPPDVAYSGSLPDGDVIVTDSEKHCLRLLQSCSDYDEPRRSFFMVSFSLLPFEDVNEEMTVIYFL